MKREMAAWIAAPPVILWNKRHVLREWTNYLDFKSWTWTIRVDSQRSITREENCDLTLCSNRNCRNCWGKCEVSQERVGVLRECRISKEREIVAEERSPIR